MRLVELRSGEGSRGEGNPTATYSLKEYRRPAMNMLAIITGKTLELLNITRVGYVRYERDLEAVESVQN